MDDGIMNTDKINGIVNFQMILTQGLDKTETKYDAQATLYKKQGKYFLFFDEINFEDNSKTKCRFEIDQDSIRIRRDGQVIMDQTFNIGESTTGYIKTVYGQLDTIAKTHRLSLDFLETQINLVLDYDLFVSAERAGNYKLIIKFNKEDI